MVLGAVVAHSGAGFEHRMDTFVDGAIDRLGVVPGFAMAVVRDDEVLYTKCYGYREVEPGEKVTTQTSFYIASSTKSFTGMAASVLAVEGVIDLDAPVTRYLPGLELPEPLSADSVTTLQLLTHTTGVNNIPVQKQLAFAGALTLEEFYAMMREHSEPMPSRFIYTNLGYNTMGYVLEQATGKRWQDVVRERVFDAVGMPNTSTSVSQTREMALPYTKEGDRFVEQRIKTDGMMHAAGGINASVSDLARWVQVNLGGGKIDGRQALPAEAVLQAHRRYTELDRTYYEFERFGYGLGWYHSRYEGDLLMHHFGGYDGFHAHVSFMPERGIGVVALMSTDAYGSSDLAHMSATYAYDVLLGKEGIEAEYAEKLDVLATEVAARKAIGDDMRLGESLHDRGEDDAMRETVTKAIQTAVAAGVLDARGINRMGYEYLNGEKPALAIAVFRVNVDLNPEDANSYDSLGEGYEALGRLPRALELFEKAISLSNDPELTAAFESHAERVTAKMAAED
jgi:CubicO group peptidase (beta-lactamase class C family)